MKTLGSGWKEYSDDTNFGEIPKPVDLKAGDKVKHEYFGMGTVRKVNETMLTWTSVQCMVERSLQESCSSYKSELITIIFSPLLHTFVISRY
jgi:hypothetical protein